jgi:hypothetical protein
MAGTFSGGTSTPRSPRATMMPSATVQDGVEVLDGLRLFELGDDPGFAAIGGDAIAHQANILRGADEGDGDGVDAARSANSRSAAVLVGERGNAHRNAGQVDALVFAEHAAVDDVADYVVAVTSCTRSSIRPSESRMREPCSTFSASVLKGGAHQRGGAGHIARRNGERRRP